MDEDDSEDEPYAGVAKSRRKSAKSMQRMQVSAEGVAADAYEKEGGDAEDKAGSGLGSQLAPALVATSKIGRHKHAVDQGRATA